MRKKMSKRLDKKVFHNTSNNVKAINLGVITYRGGIRF